MEHKPSTLANIVIHNSDEAIAKAESAKTTIDALVAQILVLEEKVKHMEAIQRAIQETVKKLLARKLNE